MIERANKLTKAEKRARWVAEPIARVEKPLRYVREKTMMPVVDPKTGRTSYEESPAARALRHAAGKGRGQFVQVVARHLHKRFG
jgi:hypothetical protein